MSSDMVACVLLKHSMYFTSNVYYCTLIYVNGAAVIITVSMYFYATFYKFLLCQFSHISQLYGHNKSGAMFRCYKIW